MSTRQIRAHCELNPDAERLDGTERLAVSHLAETIQYPPWVAAAGMNEPQIVQVE